MQVAFARSGTARVDAEDPSKNLAIYCSRGHPWPGSFFYFLNSVWASAAPGKGPAYLSVPAKAWGGLNSEAVDPDYNFMNTNKRKLTLTETISVLIASSVMILTVGCADSSKSGGDHAADDHGHDHGPGGHSHGAAEAGTPHGGTPVQVGDHGFHLELVPDPVAGKMLAYVLDAHIEKEVSVSAAPFELVATAGTNEHRLRFVPGTGGTNSVAEKTSVFSASNTALNSLTNFEGVIPKITLDGKNFENVKFRYPQGSRHEH